MAWKILLDEEEFAIDDLSVDELTAIVKSRDQNGLLKYPDLNWLALYNTPAGDPSAFYDLVCTVARKLEKPSPDRPSNIGAMASFVYKHIRVVDDDLPTAFAEGGIPLEEAGDQETITSSTSTAPVSGLQTRPGARR